jgi:Flp pilus assembly protein protease CpaA
MSKETRRIANWLLAAGILPTALGVWVMREAAAVAPHDPEHGGGMLFVSGLVFAIPGAVVIVIGIVLRLVGRTDPKHAEPAA